MSNKEVIQLLDRASQQGCAVELSSGHHYKVRCPNGATVILASTPSDNRALKNMRGLLRRYGGISI